MSAEAFSWPHSKQIALSITFDDGRPSQVDVGLPLLEECGAKATFYLLPSSVEKKLDGWRQVAAAGHEIGNHSVHHPCTGNFGWARSKALEEYTLEKMEAELLECSRLLHDLLGAAPRGFAYPCGQTFVGRGEETRSYVPVVAKHFVTGRVYMSESHNNPEFADLAHLLGRSFDNISFETFLQWVESARKESGWIILAGHEVGDGTQNQTVDAHVLRQVCEYALNPENGIWLDTVDGIAHHIKRARE